jgi:hypothetical protein
MQFVMPSHANHPSYPETPQFNMSMAPRSPGVDKFQGVAVALAAIAFSAPVFASAIGLADSQSP